MPNELMDSVIAIYGIPGAICVWVAWSMIHAKVRPDLSKEVEDLKIRMTRVETILEERQ